VLLSVLQKNAFAEKYKHPIARLLFFRTAKIIIFCFQNFKHEIFSIKNRNVSNFDLRKIFYQIFHYICAIFIYCQSEKKMRKLFVFAILLLSATFVMNAQKSKIGYVNGSEIFNLIPAKQKADTVLMSYVSELETQIKGMQDEYVAKANDFKAKEAEMSEIIKQTKTDELNSLNKRIQDFQVSAQKEVQKKQVELYTPVREKFDSALKKVAAEQGYSYIIDNSQGILLYYNESDDASKFLKKELGIK